MLELEEGRQEGERGGRPAAVRRLRMLSMPCGLTTLVEVEVGVREEEEGGGGEGDRGASPEPDSPPGLGKFDAWLSMAAAFMSVIVAMAARGPDRSDSQTEWATAVGFALFSLFF